MEYVGLENIIRLPSDVKIDDFSPLQTETWVHVGNWASNVSHEIHENSFTFRHMLFHENSNLEILPGSVLYQITTAILHVYGKMHFLLMREKEFVHGV